MRWNIKNSFIAFIRWLLYMSSVYIIFYSSFLLTNFYVIHHLFYFIHYLFYFLHHLLHFIQHLFFYSLLISFYSVLIVLKRTKIFWNITPFRIAVLFDQDDIAFVSGTLSRGRSRSFKKRHISESRCTWLRQNPSIF